MRLLIFIVGEEVEKYKHIPHRHFKYIEFPENELHPKKQVEYGEWLYKEINNNNRYVVKTHSEYIINGYRLALGKAKGENHSNIISLVNHYYDGKYDEFMIENDGTYTNCEKLRKWRAFFLDNVMQMLEQ